jgi:transcriptional regulator with XRE-family HTH domain
VDPFGHLLKHWRSRRRYSQLDLAVAANVSSRHISFLETGRSQPSRAMVLQLSEVMDVPLAERNALLASAGFSVAYVARAADSRDLQFVREAIDWTLERHDPYPAIAFDRHWRVRKLNRCATALLGRLGVGEGDSLLVAFLSPGPLRDALVNWREIARDLRTRLRTESTHFGGDPILEDAIDKLDALTNDDGYESRAPYPAVIPVEYQAGPLVLSFFSTISQFGSAEDIALADLRIELMFPANEATRRALLD